MDTPWAVDILRSARYQYGALRIQRRHSKINVRQTFMPPTTAAEASAPTVKQSASAHHHGSGGLVLLGFAIVYLIWGSTYLAMKVGIESFPPLLLAGTRHLFVGLVLYPLFRWKTGERPTWPQWRTAIITGSLLLFVGNGGVCVAEQTVPSGVAALLVATVCLWMVIVDWVRPGGHRPASRILVGIVLGFGGLILLVGPSHLGGSGRVDLKGSAIL